MAEVGMDLWAQLVWPLKQGHPEQAAQAHVQVASEHYQGRDSTASLSILCQCSVEKCFPTLRPNHPCFSLFLIPSIPFLHSSLLLHPNVCTYIYTGITSIHTYRYTIDLCIYVSQSTVCSYRYEAYLKISLPTRIILCLWETFVFALNPCLAIMQLCTQMFMNNRLTYQNRWLNKCLLLIQIEMQKFKLSHLVMLCMYFCASNGQLIFWCW